MDVSSQEFRVVMGRFASGVTVVTTCDGERRIGMTVNAFASLSLNPPLVVICLDTSTYIHEVVTRVGYFAVNILAQDQKHLSDCFARRSEYRFREFCGARSREETTGAPVLEGVVGWADCRVVNVFPGGDHSIIVGHVEALGAAETCPLLYYRGKYPHLEGNPQ